MVVLREKIIGSATDILLSLIQNAMHTWCTTYDLYKHHTHRQKWISFLPISHYKFECITLFYFGTRV